MSIPTPIRDPRRGFRLWHKSEIYTGTALGGPYVPNIDDAVWDWDSSSLYRVTGVDIRTGVSELTVYVPPARNYALTPDDVLMGVAPRRPGETYRLYVDEKTDRPTAVVDSSLHLHGSHNSYVRLFEGNDISLDTGKVISRRYNLSGLLEDDKFPLELVATTTMDNRAIKTPMAGNTIPGLTDGELVTCVVYRQDDTVSSINPLLVEKTQYVRPVNAPLRHIVDVSLESPFLADDDNATLKVPLNTPVNSLGLMAKVKYNDSTVTLPIDGNKVALHGIDAFTVSLSGQELPLVLSYRMGEDENARALSDVNGATISKPYTLTTEPQVGAYNVKLFVIPRWDGLKSRWSLEYWLYNLDRNIAKNVTNLVSVGSVDGVAYDPLDYGVVQTLTVSLDLDRVDPTYLAVRHVQTFEFTLLKPVAEIPPLWLLRYTPDDGTPYGVNAQVFCQLAETGININIANGHTAVESWLEALYDPLEPLYDISKESAPPKPTHVEVLYGDAMTTVAIEDFEGLHTLNVVPREGDSMVLRWISKDIERTFQLAASPLSVTFI